MPAERARVMSADPSLKLIDLQIAATQSNFVVMQDQESSREDSFLPDVVNRRLT